MYKRDVETNEVLLSPGEEFYDDSIEYDGVYPAYYKQIVEYSQGDIQSIAYKHRSMSSSEIHPTSSFTAAIQDIHDGLVDMSIGPFWITPQRLKLTSFTIPIIYDKTVPVIPRPRDGYKEQALKVFAPFDVWLWVILVTNICVMALLSLWFKNKSYSKLITGTNRRRSFQEQASKAPKKKRLTQISQLISGKGHERCATSRRGSQGSKAPKEKRLTRISQLISGEGHKRCATSRSG